MKTEEKYIGKCFKLIYGCPYFIPELQEVVKFTNPNLAVRITNLVGDEPAFGNLIRIGLGPFMTDDETNITIELNSSKLGPEYEFNDKETIFYMDFNYPQNK